MHGLRRRHVLGAHRRDGGFRVRCLSRELAAGDGLGGELVPLQRGLPAGVLWALFSGGRAAHVPGLPSRHVQGGRRQLVRVRRGLCAAQRLLRVRGELVPRADGADRGLRLPVQRRYACWCCVCVCMPCLPALLCSVLPGPAFSCRELDRPISDAPPLQTPRPSAPVRAAPLTHSLRRAATRRLTVCVWQATLGRTAGRARRASRASTRQRQAAPAAPTAAPASTPRRSELPQRAPAWRAPPARTRRAPARRRLPRAWPVPPTHSRRRPRRRARASATRASGWRRAPAKLVQWRPSRRPSATCPCPEGAARCSAAAARAGRTRRRSRRARCTPTRACASRATAAPPARRAPSASTRP